MEFSATLERPDGTGTWTFFPVPVAVSEQFGVRGQIKVKGTINGASYRSTLMPRGDGSHYLVVPKPLREQLSISAGSTVRVEMVRDSDPRPVAVPDDLRLAMTARPGAEEKFEALAPSYRKAFVEWIESAKRQSTRERRIVKAVEMIAEGKRL